MNSNMYEVIKMLVICLTLLSMMTILKEIIFKVCKDESLMMNVNNDKKKKEK